MAIELPPLAVVEVLSKLPETTPVEAPMAILPEDWLVLLLVGASAPTAISPLPLAVLLSPLAVLLSPLAVLLAPMAVLLAPVAVL